MTEYGEGLVLRAVGIIQGFYAEVKRPADPWPGAAPK